MVAVSTGRNCGWLQRQESAASSSGRRPGQRSGAAVRYSFVGMVTCGSFPKKNGRWAADVKAEKAIEASDEIRATTWRLLNRRR